MRACMASGDTDASLGPCEFIVGGDVNDERTDNETDERVRRSVKW